MWEMSVRITATITPGFDYDSGTALRQQLAFGEHVLLYSHPPHLGSRDPLALSQSYLGIILEWCRNYRGMGAARGRSRAARDPLHTRRGQRAHQYHEPRSGATKKREADSRTSACKEYKISNSSM